MQIEDIIAQISMKLKDVHRSLNDVGVGVLVGINIHYTIQIKI
jgi:hypothetical protein